MKRPSRGEERTAFRFALLPTTLQDGSRVWLRHYFVKQRAVQNTLKENPRWETVARIR